LNNLLHRIQSGDKSALKELFEANYPVVCATIFRFIQDSDTAKDLAQRVFIRFWEKREQITVTTSVNSYLHKMAVNEALAWLRLKSNKPSEELVVVAANPSFEDIEGTLLYDELKEQIMESIQSLPPRCRTVFQLSRFEEMTYHEIATEMNISIKTVENQMGKALKMIRLRLEPYLS
jgi:RNA polymerase sigma-70 factor, ECF subfamily